MILIRRPSSSRAEPLSASPSSVSNECLRREGAGRSMATTVAVDFRLRGVRPHSSAGSSVGAPSGSLASVGKASQDFAANALRSKAAAIGSCLRLLAAAPLRSVTVDGSRFGRASYPRGSRDPAGELSSATIPLACAHIMRPSLRPGEAERAGAFAGDWIEPSRWRRREPPELRALMVRPTRLVEGRPPRWVPARNFRPS